MPPSCLPSCSRRGCPSCGACCSPPLHPVEVGGFVSTHDDLGVPPHLRHVCSQSPLEMRFGFVSELYLLGQVVQLGLEVGQLGEVGGRVGGPEPECLLAVVRLLLQGPFGRQSYFHFKFIDAVCQLQMEFLLVLHD